MEIFKHSNNILNTSEWCTSMTDRTLSRLDTIFNYYTSILMGFIRISHLNVLVKDYIHGLPTYSHVFEFNSKLEGIETLSNFLVGYQF